VKGKADGRMMVLLMLKRRRNKKTDYRQRLALLKSGLPRLVVRRSLRYIHVQVAKSDEKGDKIILEDSSKSLKRYGWLCHTGNIPAAYLTGLLLGLNARRKGIENLVLDIGLQTSVKGSALYAVVAGVTDAGIKVPFGKNIVPTEDRISSKHISAYASKLKEENNEKYRRLFSSYIKAGIEPEKITENFEQVKNKVIEEFGVEIKRLKVSVAGNDSSTYGEEELKDGMN